MALLKDLTVFGATNLIDDTFVNNIYGNGFHHNAHDTDTYFLLAGGGAKALNTLATSTHNHNGGAPKLAWGQQYVDANGTLTTISGNIDYVGNITPDGNSNTKNLGSSAKRWAKLYIGTTDSYGSATQGIYWNAGVPTACTVSINSGTTDKLTYYSSNTAISAYTSNKGSLTKGIYLAAGVPTEMTYSLNATISAAPNGVSSNLAYYYTENNITYAATLWYENPSLWVGVTSDTEERDIGVRSVAGILYMFAQNSSTGYRGLYTKNYVNSETFVILIDKDNNITFNGDLSGNASTATKLATARTLWGQSFDGTDNVSGNMTSVGNISFSASGKNIGGILYFDTTNSRLGIGTSSPSYKLHVVGDIYTTTGFKKKDSSNSYVLLGGGGHKLESNLSVSNADTVDGYHAYSSNQWNGLKTLGNDGVIELGRYIDMHFIANDANDYSTRIQLISNPNPANVLSLPTETGTLVTDVHPYGYVMKEYWVDYSTSNVDTYYPVIFDLSNHKKDNVRIEVIVALDSETVEGTGSTAEASEAAAKPAWANHKTTTQSNGTYTTKREFSCCAIWEVNGSGWGTSVIRRTIYAWDWGWCDGTNGQCPMANIGQLSNSSEEYILLRGGGKYRIRTSHGVIPVAKYARYDGWDEQSISPISYNTSSNSWPDTLNVSGCSIDPNIIDMGTKDNFGTTYGIFKYIGSSSTTLTVEIGGVRRTCTINPGIYVYNNYSSVTTIYPIGINSSGEGRWTTFFKRSEFYFTSEGAYHTSDIRKKYDIYDILNNDVNQLFETENGFIRHFKWKETSSDAYGFIAQELQEYCPEAVDLNEDNGYYSVNYNVAFSKIIGAMFKKIKELERKLQEKENH